MSNTQAALLAAIVTLAASTFAVVAATTSRTDSTPGAPTTEPAAASPAASGLDITIDKFAFDPLEITVAAGSAVTWTNAESVTHNVFTTDEQLASPDLAEGDTYTVTLSEPAVVEYYCDIHQYMRGTVTVTP